MSVQLLLVLTLFACTSLASVLPKPYEVSDDDVTFFLRTRESGEREVQLSLNNLEELDVRKPTYFLVHGKGASRNSSWYDEVTEAYLKKGDYNVVQVDYSRPASQEEEAAVRDAKFVGQIIANLISTLIEDYSASPSNFNLVGHSLGAHVSGFTGKNVIKNTGEAVAEIVGLDPANLDNLSLLSNDDKLYKEDADLVVVIHTDGLEGGSLDPIGNIDFYPNGGQAPQPGCEGSQAVCSHMKSTEYFPEAISNANGFVSTKCVSYEEYDAGSCADNKKITLGGELTLEDEGVYYLYTNPEKPYSKE